MSGNDLGSDRIAQLLKLAINENLAIRSRAKSYAVLLCL